MSSSPFDRGATLANLWLQDLKRQLEKSRGTYQAEIRQLESDLRVARATAAAATSESAQIKSSLATEQQEKSKLFNQVMDLKGRIRVFARIRPLLAEEASPAVYTNAAEPNTLTIASQAYGSSSQAEKAFAFDRVFHPGHSQEDVFEEVQPMITSALDGYNVCIFAYGQTGSGKVGSSSWHVHHAAACYDPIPAADLHNVRFPQCSRGESTRGCSII